MERKRSYIKEINDVSEAVFIIIILRSRSGFIRMFSSRERPAGHTDDRKSFSSFS